MNRIIAERRDQRTKRTKRTEGQGKGQGQVRNEQPKSKKRSVSLVQTPDANKRQQKMATGNNIGVGVTKSTHCMGPVDGNRIKESEN